MPVFITYFVHGTTTNNELGLATGWRDGKLSALGVKQSMELKRNLKKKFDVVFCSDLGRAIETAEIVFGEFVIDKRLRECDYGDMTGKHIEDLNLEKHIYEPFPNGESLKDVEKRVSDFLEFLRKNYDGKRVAIVSHQAPQLAMDVLIKGKSWKQAIREDWRKTGDYKPGWDYILE